MCGIDLILFGLSGLRQGGNGKKKKALHFRSTLMCYMSWIKDQINVTVLRPKRRDEMKTQTLSRSLSLSLFL